MLNIIIGDNCTGKTRVLLDMINQSSDLQDMVTNVKWVPTFEKIDYNYEIIRRLEDNIDSLYIVTDDKACLTAEDVEYSHEFMKQLTYLCKDVNNVFLDEPDINISNNEICAYIAAVLSITDLTPNSWIVTHEERLLDRKSEYIKYYNVIEETSNDFKLVEVSL